MQTNIYFRIRRKGKELVRINIGVLIVGAILGAIIGALCFCSAGCQSAKAVKNRTVSALATVDGAFVAVDGTADALEAGTIEPKAAADDLHEAAATGKDASKQAARGVEDLSKRAEKAEDALADRARSRIELALIIGGLLAWAADGVLGYGFVQGGALAGGSVIRKAGVIVALFLAGCACFAAAVYFDRILAIGAWTLAAGVLVAGIVFWLHHRKHKGASDEVAWFIANAAKDEAVAGGKDALNFADQRLHALAERTLSDSAFAKWREEFAGLLK
jgi:hypothetical protein